MNPVELTREDVERTLARMESFIKRDGADSFAGWLSAGDMRALCQAALRGMESQGGFEIRCNDDGTLDEIIGTGSVHLEQMNTDHWWLGFGDGPLLHVNLHARGKIKANVLDERALAQPRGEREPPHCPTCDCATPAKDSE